MASTETIPTHSVRELLRDELRTMSPEQLAEVVEAATAELVHRARQAESSAGEERVDSVITLNPRSIEPHLINTFGDYINGALVERTHPFASEDELIQFLLNQLRVNKQNFLDSMMFGDEIEADSPTMIELVIEGTQSEQAPRGYPPYTTNIISPESHRSETVGIWVETSELRAQSALPTVIIRVVLPYPLEGEAERHFI